jgi:hypothetical protein
MKSKFLKICIAGSVLSVAGLAKAATLTEADMLTYSAISGAAVNIAAQPQPQPQDSEATNVGGHLAARAAVTIGANAVVNGIYAGAEVTTGAGSQVKQIYAGAAVTIGANGAVGVIDAGVAIALGAGATYGSITSKESVVTEGAGATDDVRMIGTDLDEGFIVDAGSLTDAINDFDEKFNRIDNSVTVDPRTDMSNSHFDGTQSNDPFYHSTINLQAQSNLYIDGDVTVITSGSVTLGAGANIILGDGATVTWILGGSLNLGANSDFNGVAYVRGAINGATSDVGAGKEGCANLYASGPISVRSIGQACQEMVTKSECPMFPASAVSRFREDMNAEGNELYTHFSRRHQYISTISNNPNHQDYEKVIGHLDISALGKIDLDGEYDPSAFQVVVLIPSSTSDEYTYQNFSDGDTGWTNLQNKMGLTWSEALTACIATIEDFRPAK